MKAPVKIGLVTGGYVAALLLALGIVAVQGAFTGGPGTQASAGMASFSDGVLLLAVFSLASIPSTVAGLYFLRPYASFWRALVVAALAIAATGVGALGVHIAARAASAGSTLESWSLFAVLRILMAPLFALGFLLSGALSPDRPVRVGLFVATLVEVTIFIVSVLGIWFGARGGGNVY